jgi:hypothetical protein
LRIFDEWVRGPSRQQETVSVQMFRPLMNSSRLVPDKHDSDPRRITISSRRFHEHSPRSLPWSVAGRGKYHKEVFSERRPKQGILRPSARPRYRAPVTQLDSRNDLHFEHADCRNTCFILYNILCYAMCERNIVSLRGNWGERCRSTGKSRSR